MRAALYRQEESDAAEAWDRLCLLYGAEALWFVRLGAGIGYKQDRDVLRLLAEKGDEEAIGLLRLLRIGRELTLAVMTGGRTMLPVTLGADPDAPTDADIEDFITFAREALKRR